MTERIAIIDHDTHQLFIEDIDTEILKKEYGGEEEKYILDNYSFNGRWDWEFIIDIEYFPEDGDPISVEPKDLL